MTGKEIFEQVLQLPEDEQRALQELLEQKQAENHWGKRVIAAIEALDPEIRNDPAYADPVAWVKRAREKLIHPDPDDSSDIDQ
jgi:hypothetical protein